jgi:hypothetical protein
VVAPAGPALPVRAGRDRVGFGVGEVVDQRFVAAFGGDGEYAGDEGGVFGVSQGREGKEAADGGEAGVAGAWTVVPVDL